MSAITLLEDGKTVLVEDLEIQNETVYKLLEELDEEDREDAFQRAVLIGCVALRRMGPAEDLDYIEKEFDRFMNKMSADMDDMFNVGKEGSHLYNLAKKLEGYFDEGGTVEGMLDCTDEGSPLFKMREDIKKEITELRNDLFKKKGEEEIIEVTPIKGFEFEDLCEEKLEEIAKHFGDEVINTSEEFGEMEGSKAGDFVVVLNERPDLRIVIEAKDKKSVTLPQIHGNLEESMENRNAEYGIFVIKNGDALPKQVGHFNEYPGNQLVTVFGIETEGGNDGEMLEIAYKWARNRLLFQKGVATGVDLSAVGDRLNEIEASMKNFTQVLKQCTNVEKASKNIRELIDRTRSEISDAMEEIWEEIREAEGGEE